MPAHATDDEAFTRVFDAWWPRLFAFAHRQIQDADAASDVAQEAFVRLYGRGEMPEDPGGWLTSVANNLLRDRSRKRLRRVHLLEANPGEAGPEPLAPPPDEATQRAEELERVRFALGSLPARQSQVLLLRASGLSYSEISESTQMPATSVGKTLSRALAAFRTAYQDSAHAPV